MARVTLYTDKSKVGETTRAEAGADYMLELGKRVLNLNTESARGLDHYLHSPLRNKPLIFPAIQPVRSLLNNN